MLFTVHRRRAWSLIAGCLAALSAIEGAGVHLALAPHAPVVAWVLTAGSISMIAWLVDDARALARGGVTVDARGVQLAIGRRWRGALPWHAIDRVERISARPPRAPELVRAGVLGADLMVHLRAPCELRGPGGVRRRARRVALAIDDVDGFAAAIAPHLG